MQTLSVIENLTTLRDVWDFLPDIPGVFSQGETSEMLDMSRPEVSICCPVNLIAF